MSKSISGPSNFTRLQPVGPVQNKICVCLDKRDTHGSMILAIPKREPCYVVQTISLSTSGQLTSAVILLMGDNKMALLSIEWVYRVKECTPARSC